jgi:hypothetical protein
MWPFSALATSIADAAQGFSPASLSAELLARKKARQ